MCDHPDLDIDTLRLTHESPPEWNLRRKFLMAHKDTLPLATLKCMSSCFINMELSGCQYPPRVTARVRELAEAIGADVQKHRDEVKARTEVKFVKASANSEPGTSKTGADLPKTLSAPSLSKKRSAAPPPTSGIAFVKSSDSYSTTEHVSPEKMPKVEKPAIDPKFIRYQREVMTQLQKDKTADAMSILSRSAHNTHITVNVTFNSCIDGQHSAKVLIDFVVASEESASQKKTAKRKAATSALELLKKKHLRIVSTGPDEFKFEGSNEPFEAKTDLRKTPPTFQKTFEQPKKEQFSQKSIDQSIYQRNKAGDRPNTSSRQQGRGLRQQSRGNRQQNDGLFVLAETETQGSAYPVNLLHSSCELCQVNIKYEFKYESSVTCFVEIENIYSGQATGINEKEAKRKASIRALNDLRKIYYTMQMKKRSDDPSDGLNIGEIGAKATNTAVPDSNVGNKLLKMMGWSGGGIGKDGQGIAEPVKLDAVINREGLGLGTSTGVTGSFKQKIQHVLEDYVRGGDKKDLVFSSDLTNVERKVIHEAGRKLGLKTRSYNKSKEERYLVVARKMTWRDAFRELIDQGGETEKYRLFEPGSFSEIKEDE